MKVVQMKVVLEPTEPTHLSPPPRLYRWLQVSAAWLVKVERKDAKVGLMLPTTSGKSLLVQHFSVIIDP